MPLIQSITQSYRNPQLVFRQMWVAGVVESKSLALVMGASVAGFISALPELARRAHLESLDLQQLMGGALLGWIFMAPLMFYCLALVLYWILGLFLKTITAAQMRVIVFWSLVVAVPVLLLHGLVAGFIGPSVQKQIIGIVWIAVVMRTFISGVRSTTGNI